MFTGLRSRLMLSFAALLLVCLSVVSITFTLLFFVWVSLPELAYAHLADTAVPALEYVRNARTPETRLTDSFAALRTLAQERKVRFLLVLAADGTILADTEQAWAGKTVRIGPGQETGVARSTLRGRTRGPDRKLLFYMAFPVQDARGDASRRAYLVLATTLWDTARPIVGSMIASVLLSGAIAFAFSILFALWLARTLARPLQRAAAAAEQVAAGDYTTSLHIAAPDEAHRLAESFNAMTRAVAASQRSQRDFVANVSHELRTPLTSIQGFAQAILDGTAGDTETVHRAATVIQQEANRLTRMVHKLLDLARLESGEGAMSWSQINLPALLRACTDRLALSANEKGVELQVQTPDELHLLGDGDRLMQVFTNLIDNALKQTGKGGKVALSASTDGNLATVTVTDTGGGIPETDLPRIFERFYQVDGSRSRDRDPQHAGLGLGLAIASEIIRAHGGQIDVRSIVNVGTQFTVTWPCKPAAALSKRVPLEGVI